MAAFSRFFRKELTEFVRTWRLPVLGGALLFFALTGPVMALLTPEILKYVTAGQPGVVLKVPDPTFVDAYFQWTKNMSQIGSIVAITLAAGTVAGELASGTAILVLTKPVSRFTFVAAKTTALLVAISATVVVGTAVTQGVTLAVFGEAPGTELWAATGVWLAFVAMVVALTVLLSAMLPTLAAAGVGIGLFMAMSALTLFEPLTHWSPVGLMTAPNQLLAGEDPSTLLPLASALVVTAVLTAAAGLVFSRREL